jgi:hypothetical protein
VLLLLDEEGMEHAAGKGSVLYSMIQQGYSVVLFVVPGIGSLGPGFLKGDAYFDKTSFNQWFAGILTNKSIVGMRAEDIVRIAHFIKSDVGGFEVVSALAKGALGSELLHAAVFDESIQKVGLINPFISFADIALSQEYVPSFIPSTVAGAIDKYDLPDLMALLCPKKIAIINPQTSSGKEARHDDASLALSFPTDVFVQQGVEDYIELVIERDDQLVDDKIINWLE